MKFCICFMTEQEFFHTYTSHSFLEELRECLVFSTSSKVEIGRDMIIGVVRVPYVANGTARKEKGDEIKFGFYLHENALTIIEENPVVEMLWKQIQKKNKGSQSASLSLLAVLEELSCNDMLFLQHLEKEMGHIEDVMMRGDVESFSPRFLRYRRIFSSMHYYYEQMIDFSELLQAEYGRRDQKNERDEWQQYRRRMERLHDYVNFLREYVSQLRELYHTQLDDRQNKGINFLTILTSLFFPLTLLTGWYGMNFESMPEVAWDHGYVMVIVVAVIIIVLEIWFIKKKKIL